MSITEIGIKIGGGVLFIAGLLLILSAIGLHIVAVSFINEWVSVILGIVLMGFGIYIIRGGTPKL